MGAVGGAVAHAVGSGVFVTGVGVFLPEGVDVEALMPFYGGKMRHEKLTHIEESV